jgi:hypothetical protein
MQHDFILLDRSGSMATRWVEAISSVNAYVKELANTNVDTGVTLAVFDTNSLGKLDFVILRDRITPPTWREVAGNEVYPRNGTPLNDATGELLNLAERGGYDKVAIIIMTDGEENSSHEYTVEAIRARLDACRAKNWQVIFLGANFDNQRQAASFGNQAASTMVMPSGTMRASTQAVASKRAHYGVTGQSINFTEEEKAKLAQQNNS